MVDHSLPSDPTLLYRRGAECLARGDAAGAVRHLERAVALTPGYAWAHHNLGQAYRALGNTTAAERALRRAVQVDPAYAIAFANLGTLLAESGRLAEAVEALGRARSLAPDSAQIKESYVAAIKVLAVAFADSGDAGRAFAAYRLLLRENPHDDNCLRLLATLLGWVRFNAADDGLFADLESILASPFADPLRAAAAVVSALLHHPEIKHLMSVPIDVGAADRLAGVPLLIAIMTTTTLPDLRLEALLTNVRRRLLEKVDQIEPESGAMRFAAALAHLGFINEYIFAETGDEARSVEVLAADVSASIAAGEQPPAASVAVLASYRPLGAFAWANALLSITWPDDLRRIVIQQVVEPRDEKRRLASIPQLTTIEHDVSRTVRAQYECNPYPRWTRVATPMEAQRVSEHCRRWCPGESFESLPADPDILLAGCGTGRQALYAATWYRAKSILAIDLSLASLAYAARKAQELGVGNLEFGQADLLKVSELGRRFDFIESVGVLHHLADPAAGLRALADVLRPGGVMRLGLYSARERRGWFDKVRSLLHRHGLELPTSAEDIRRARQLIVSNATGPSADPDLANLIAYHDFFGLSDCRDLAFHVREHSFEVEGLEDLMAAGGLEFVGFEAQVNDAAIRAFRRQNGPDAPLSALPLWRDVERSGGAPVVFRFICRKAG